MNDLPLPQEFTNEIASRKQRKINGVKLAVSVSLLNTARNDLAFDFDGSVPSYSNFNDRHIEEAYFKHLEYIATELKPEYLLLAIEVNELLKNAPEKWDGYKKLMANIRPRIKQRFSDIVISESITLHNLYKPDVSNQDAFIEEVVDYANGLDLVTISFYPYFKGLRNKEEFQDAFDYLHEKISKPIAFSETSHLSEDLLVPTMLVDIKGNEEEQDEYMETLLVNAQEKDYEYIIWWCHRDYNELWEVFPDEVKDIGKLWISTGIVNEDGRNKKGIETWKSVLAY